MVRGRRGQVLVIAALAIALTLLSTQAYIYHLSRLEASSPYSSLGDYILGVEQGSRHAVVASLIEEEEEEAEWLLGWDHRVQINIDHNDIDSDLFDFPVLIHLGSSSGRNGDDVSFVFDELQGDANRKKIAVTTGDGTTQCYVEIEKWDDANEEAWLWVKIPSVNNASDTELYLYYDADRADNTEYVGDPNSSPAEVVWDNDYRLVSHMRDDPYTSLVRDSTENDNDGTKTAPGEPVVTTSGIMSDAQDFDGDDDIVVVSDDASMNIRTSLTMEVWVNATGYDPIWNDVLSKMCYDIYIEDGRLGAWFMTDAGLYDDWPGGTTIMVVGTWYYLAVTYDAGAIASYIDGALDGTASKGTIIDDSTGWNFIIGWHNDTDEGIHWMGIIDEVRISNVSRSAEWIKACYESGRDDLVDFVVEKTSLIKKGWLPGWGKRVKLTVDQNDVDGDLIGFPVLVYLSNSSGRNGDDISFVFDELQSDANRKKIAVTTSDGTTQCYVEIERWDDASEEAWLWVRVPIISSSADTVLYLYYDGSHADNTDYVGDIGSIPAQGVWDSSFEGVYHLQGDPEAPINWGMKKIGDLSTTSSHSRAMGGTSPDVDDMTIESITIYLGAQTGDVRLAVYTGGQLNDPSTATLLWDAGTVNPNGAAGWYTIEHPGGGVSWPKNTTTWIAWKRNTGVTVYYDSTSTYAGDFQTVRGRNDNNFNQDPSVAFPSTYGDTGTFDDYWYSVYVSVEIDDGNPLRDGTSNRNDPIPLGSMTSGDQVSGQMDGGLDFDGSDDYLYTLNSFNNPQEFTVEAWFKTSSASGRKIVGFEDLQVGETSAYWDRQIYIGTDGRAYFGCYSGSTDVAVSTSSLDDGAWHYAAGVRNDATDNVYLYIDGNLNDTTPNPFAEYFTGYWRIGGYRAMGWPNGADGYFPGTIDEVRISTGVRTASWIRASYESGVDDMISYGGEETREGYMTEASSILTQNLERWESFVAGDYRFGRCDLNATPYSQAPYTGGVWIEWGSMGKGVSGACSDFTLNLSGRGADCDWGFNVNATTTVLLSGSYQQVGGEKQVTVYVNVLNDGEPALAGSVTVSYRVDGGPWEDANLLYDYGLVDHGNGTYVCSFTVEAQAGEIVRVCSQIYDRREIYVRTEVTPT